MVDETGVESALENLGLQVQRIELKTRPCAAHWHARKKGERGTLEATLESGSVTFSVRSNRSGDWTEGALEHLVTRFGPQK